MFGNQINAGNVRFHPSLTDAPTFSSVLYVLIEQMFHHKVETQHICRVQSKYEVSMKGIMTSMSSEFCMSPKSIEV